MGEHRDNEPELDSQCPIASVSLGQERQFVLKHRDARKSGPEKKLIPTGKLQFSLFKIFILINSYRIVNILKLVEHVA